MESFKRYTPEDAESILRAYRLLFPDADQPALRTYFDSNQQRPWSLLSTDFHNCRLLDLQKFDRDRDALRLDGLHASEAVESIRALRRSHSRIGGSFGFSPWTDTLLLQTFRPGITRLLIVLGHDWYPIVPMKAQDGQQRIRTNQSFRIEARSPFCRYELNQNPCLQNADDYAAAIPLISDSETSVLFLNLVPDLRPIGAKATGKYPFFDTGLESYGQCLDLVMELLKSALNQQVEILGLITWGSVVRMALARQLNQTPKALAQGQRIELGRHHPLIIAGHHPSAWDRYFSDGRPMYYQTLWNRIQAGR